jgi:hypothetical protein
MILRIDASISSMLGSPTLSGLFIAHLADQLRLLPVPAIFLPMSIS